MRHKLVLFSVLSLVVFYAAATILPKYSNASDPRESKLWNLQKLEEIAEAGNVEAQLRLVDFYKININSRDHYREKHEYWHLKAEAQKSSKEYLAAKEKLNEEQKNYWQEQQEREKQMKQRLTQLQEKYKNVPPDAQNNDPKVWHDSINAVFQPQKIYTWKTPLSLKYRLTINIETPEGVKSGSTVQEIFYPPADNENIYNPYNQGVPRGEAAFIDLGERGTVFAIMQDPANARNRFLGLIRTVFPTVPIVHDQSRYQEVLQHYNDLSGVKDEVPPEHYPMFVYFKNINDPQSIELVYERKQGSRKDMKQVDTDRFEEVFGKGVRIKSMIMEMTDDPLEWKLGSKLPWIENMSEKDVTRALREAKPPIHITNGIGYYVFRQGQVDPLEKIKAEKKAQKEITEKLSNATAYDDYSQIPQIFMQPLHNTMTLDKYLEHLKKYFGKDVSVSESSVHQVALLDMNQNGLVTTDEAYTAAINAFVTVDTNKDGRISYNESETFTQNLIRSAKSKRDK